MGLVASLLAEIKNDGKQIEELRVGVGRGKRIIAGGTEFFFPCMLILL